MEHITPESLATKRGDRRHSQFVEDETGTEPWIRNRLAADNNLVPETFRAKLKDYIRSGYDRGHQVPAADAQFSQDAMDDTFVLTNICPQVGDGFNRDYWSHFEHFCRRLTTKYPSVRIITGPLYLPKLHQDGKWRVSYEVIGTPPNVAVPTHFFKVIVAEDGSTSEQVTVGAFVLPNAIICNKTPLREFSTSIDMVERASGLELLGKLPAIRRKELCKQIDCSLSVREFNSSRKALSLCMKGDWYLNLYLTWRYSDIAMLYLQRHYLVYNSKDVGVQFARLIWRRITFNSCDIGRWYLFELLVMRFIYS